MKYKGVKLRILVYLIVAVVAPLLLYFTDPNAFPSMSQYAKNFNEIWLDMFLIAVGLMYIEAATNFIGRGANMYKLFGIRVRYEHWYVFTSMFFFGILLTDVVEPYLQIPHFLLTGLAVLLVYTRMMRYTSWFYVLMANVGLIAFLIGFTTSLYTTFWGEYVMALCGAVFMFNENRRL